MNISPARRIPVLLKDASAEDEAYLARHRTWLERLAGVESITLLALDAEAPRSAMALAGTLTILVPMAGLIDAEAEAERLGRLLARAQADLEKIRAQLARESFVSNAPEHVVAGYRDRGTDLERTAAELAAQIERLRGPKP
jgi:valyl-tRNA synthetase